MVKTANKSFHLTAKSGVPLRYTLLFAASEFGRYTPKGTYIEYRDKLSPELTENAFNRYS